MTVDGTPVRFRQAFLRAALGLVDFFLIPIGFVAVVSALVSPRDQRLGDLAAGTLVVRERSAGADVAPAQFRAAVGLRARTPRRSTSPPSARASTRSSARSCCGPATSASARASTWRCASANPVAVRIGHTPPPDVHPHAFLECVAARWQLTHAPRPAAVPDEPPYGSRQRDYGRAAARLDHAHPAGRQLAAAVAAGDAGHAPLPAAGTPTARAAASAAAPTRRTHRRRPTDAHR